jgi:hypothetical protein
MAPDFAWPPQGPDGRWHHNGICGRNHIVRQKLDSLESLLNNNPLLG